MKYLLLHVCVGLLTIKGIIKANSFGGKLGKKWENQVSFHPELNTDL